MIVAYDKNEKGFVTNGLVVLNDCKSCFITEELNGQYELELEYPLDPQKKWGYLKEDNIIKADGQLFRIYRKVPSLEGIKVYARHIFYDNLDNLVEEVDIRGISGISAMDRVFTGTAYPHGFKIMSDLTAINNIFLDDEGGDIIRQNPIEALFKLIDIYGGELYRDNFNIKWLQHIGTDRGVLIAYGKNIMGIEEDLDTNSVITRIMPLGTDELMLDEKYVDSPNINSFAHPKIKVVQFADVMDYDTLRTETKKYYEDTKCDFPKVNYRINFLELSKTEEYKHYQVLERVFLGDTVMVKHSILNLNLKCRVIKIKKDAITGRIEEVELGNAKNSLEGMANTVLTVDRLLTDKGNVDVSFLEGAIKMATNLILSGNNGHLIMDVNGLSIMDTEDKMTAKEVWRWNLGGLGFSSTGWDGPFRTAITKDGHIVADFIDVGVLQGGLIKAGSIKSQSLEVVTQEKINSIEGKATKAELKVATDNITMNVTETNKNLNSLDNKLKGVNSTLTDKIGAVDIKADNINLSVKETNRRLKDNKDELDEEIAKIDIKANNINLSVKETNENLDTTTKDLIDRIGAIDVKAGNINLKVSEIVKDYVKSAEIIMTVNSQGSNVKIKADKVDVEGILSADNIKAARLLVGEHIQMGPNAVINWDNLSYQSKQNLQGPPGIQGPQGIMGPQGYPGMNGSDAQIPQWVREWTGAATSISGQAICTPYLWSGYGGGSTGIGIGCNSNGYRQAGIFGYSNGSQTFALNADGSAVFGNPGQNNNSMSVDTSGKVHFNFGSIDIIHLTTPGISSTINGITSGPDGCLQLISAAGIRLDTSNIYVGSGNQTLADYIGNAAGSTNVIARFG